MDYASILISSAITILGIAISTLVIIRQITLQRRLSYITSMLADAEIMHWYKIFLKDLRFIYETLEVFPDLQIRIEDLEFVHKSRDKKIKLEYLTTYIRHVLRHGGRLQSKYPELAKLTDTNYDPKSVFTDKYYDTINDFTKSIVHGLTYHPTRPWFIALFSPAKNRYQRLISLISDRDLTSKDRIIEIEFEVREFMMGKW